MSSSKFPTPSKALATPTKGVPTPTKAFPTPTKAPVSPTRAFTTPSKTFATPTKAFATPTQNVSIGSRAIIGSDPHSPPPFFGTLSRSPSLQYASDSSSSSGDEPLLASQNNNNNNSAHDTVAEQGLCTKLKILFGFGENDDDESGCCADRCVIM